MTTYKSSVSLFFGGWVLRLGWLACFLSTALHAQQPPSRSAAPRIALVMGVSDYQHLPKLVNPTRDASLIAQALAAKGFSVTQSVNPSREKMLSAVSDFEQTLATSGGIGIFYYAGHAAYLDGGDVMFPIDANVTDRQSIATAGVHLWQLQQGGRAPSPAHPRDNGTVTIYSASKGQMAFDGINNSPFTLALFDALGNLPKCNVQECVGADEGDVQRIFRLLRKQLELPRVPGQADLMQTPEMRGQLIEKIFLNESRRDHSGRVSRILFFDASRDDSFDMKK
jgi:hypothetical protein